MLVLPPAAILSGWEPRKLDETIFYEGPQFKLKLVRYYENLPFHYTGEVFSVQCSSSQTAGSPSQKRQDAGWVSIGSGGAIGSTSAGELAEKEQNHYLVMDENTLIVKGTVLRVSFDACGTFRDWDPSTLSKDFIDPVEKPDHCAPKGTADCRYYDFLGDRQPQYQAIQTNSSGHVEFQVRSKSFRDGAVLHVESDDFGKSWRVDRAKQGRLSAVQLRSSSTRSPKQTKFMAAAVRPD